MEEILTALYFNAVTLSHRTEQTVGEKNDYYITLEQLESLIQQVPKI